jgi:hypothetical protein
MTDRAANVIGIYICIGGYKKRKQNVELKARFKFKLRWKWLKLFNHTRNKEFTTHYCRISTRQHVNTKTLKEINYINKWDASRTAASKLKAKTSVEPAEGSYCGQNTTLTMKTARRSVCSNFKDFHCSILGRNFQIPWKVINTHNMFKSFSRLAESRSNIVCYMCKENGIKCLSNGWCTSCSVQPET